MNALSFIKWVGGPGSLGFAAVGTVAGLMLMRLWPRTRTLGLAVLITLFIGYVTLALPAVALSIASPFADDSAGRQTVEPGLDTLVVFAGDNAEARIDLAERLWLIAHPRVVIASGESWFLDRLLERGIPRASVVHEDTAGTTREQVEFLKAYMAAHPNERSAVIASRLQMPRVAALVRRAGLTVHLYAARVDEELRPDKWKYFPTYIALKTSRDALYERVALVYYQWRGWIDEPAIHAYY